MVVQAYILIQTDVGKAAEVAAQITDITGVIPAEDVPGPYDVTVRAEARNVDELGKLVVAKVQTLDGITRTLTCPVVHTGASAPRGARSRPGARHLVGGRAPSCCAPHSPCWPDAAATPCTSTGSG